MYKRQPYHETESYKARVRARSKARRERIRNDPELLAKEQAEKRDRKARHRARMGTEGPGEMRPANYASITNTNTQFLYDGRELSLPQQRELFVKLYPDRGAIGRLWPNLTERQISSKAEAWIWPKVAAPKYREHEDAILRALYPNFSAVRTHLPHRSSVSLYNRAARLGLTRAGDQAGPYTADEDDLLLSGQPVPGRSARSVYKRCRVLGVKRANLRRTRKLTGDELYAMVLSAVPRTVPKQVRDEVEADLMLACLSGKIAPTEKAVRDAVKKAITAVYKMHPDRGAHLSMDAKLFDDGEGTLGDRISDEAFRF